MKRLIIALILLSSCSKSTKDFDFTTRFESSQGLETATYEETITYYRNLAEAFATVSIDSIGETDAGKLLIQIVDLILTMLEMTNVYFL